MLKTNDSFVFFCFLVSTLLKVMISLLKSRHHRCLCSLSYDDSSMFRLLTESVVVSSTFDHRDETLVSILFETFRCGVEKCRVLRLHVPLRLKFERSSHRRRTSEIPRQPTTQRNGTVENLERQFRVVFFDDGHEVYSVTVLFFEQ